MYTCENIFPHFTIYMNKIFSITALYAWRKKIYFTGVSEVVIILKKIVVEEVST